MKRKFLLSGIILFSSLSLSAYQYEVTPMIGNNFSDDDSVLDDSTTFGLRVNKYVSEDNAIQFGYNYHNDVKYRNKIDFKNRRSTTSNRTCPSNLNQGQNVNPNGGNGAANKPQNRPGINNANDNKVAVNNNGANGNNKPNGIGNSVNNNKNNGAAGGGTTIPGKNGSIGSSDKGAGVPPTDIIKKVNSGFVSGNTDLHQFYINGVHEIGTKFNKLKPYVYGGFGYEHVTEEKNGLESQGFFDAGAGLKYRIADNVNLVSDIQAIKKFDDKNLDFLGSVGVGFLFGDTVKQAPEAYVKIQTDELELQPKPIEMTPIEPVVEKGYYIQMAAAFKTELEKDCKHYIHEIHKAGFNYTIKDTTIKNQPVSLLLVGPYVSKSDAREDLLKLREIEQDAFIKQI